jgi:hypothetical protein
MMDQRQLERLKSVLCAQFGVQAGNHVLGYVQSRLNDTTPFFILGTDARTGVPIQPSIDPVKLVQALQQSGDAAS